MKKALATLQKIIKEILKPREVSCSKDVTDLISECCVEFITLLTSEANEIAEKDGKKTICGEHVVRALTDLGFEEYVHDVSEEAAEHKELAKRKERKTRNSTLDSGLTEEQLAEQQSALFAAAAANYEQQHADR